MSGKSFELRHEYLRAWLLETEKKLGKRPSTDELLQTFNTDLADIRVLRPTWKKHMVPDFKGIIDEERIKTINTVKQPLEYGSLIYDPNTRVLKRRDTQHIVVLPDTRHLIFHPLIAYPEHLFPTTLIVQLLGYDPTNLAAYQRGINNTGTVIERIRKDIGDARFAPDFNVRVFEFIQKNSNGYFLKQFNP